MDFKALFKTVLGVIGGLLALACFGAYVLYSIFKGMQH